MNEKKDDNEKRPPRKRFNSERGEKPRKRFDNERGDKPRKRFGKDDERRGKRGHRDENKRGRSANRESTHVRGGTRGGGRSDRGGAKREFTEAERLEHSLRPVREKHDDPLLPEDVTSDELHPAARNELKTLDKENAELVAKHLAMVARLIDDDTELARQHAISAMRRAGRIPVTRETYAITSYLLGDFATALRELRTYRRLSGRNDQLALMIDSERGLGRPERALELAREIDASKLASDQKVQVAIALSGARLDMGQTLQALYELEIKELDKNKAFPWSPELFAAYSAVLEDLGRNKEAAEWQKRAYVAEELLMKHRTGDSLEVFEIQEIEDEKPSIDVTETTEGPEPEEE